MSTPKRHHYVPEMILNGFTNQDGWLHWCRVREKPTIIRPTRPAQLFLQNHLYSTVSETGIKDPAMERAFASLESDAARVVNRIVDQARAGGCPALTADQKQIWYLFFFLQWRRTPENQRSVTSDAEGFQMLEEALGELRTALPDRHNEIEALASPEAKARILRNVRVNALKDLSSNVMATLERRGITILRINKPNKSFIVGSRPVVKLTVPGRTDLADPVVELWMPIASDVVVGAGRGDGSVSLGYLNNGKPIRQLNAAIASQSSIIAAGSAALVRSLANPR